MRHSGLAVLMLGVTVWCGTQLNSGWADHGGRNGASPSAAAIHRPSEIKWQRGPASLPAGAEFAVLEGDPTKAGPFTFRVKVPDGYRIPPHLHPKTERVTVIRGTFRLGMGDKFDATALRSLPGGTYGYWPAGMKHFVQTEGETIVQFHGIGPWEIVYLNPGDDPRRVSQ